MNAEYDPSEPDFYDLIGVDADAPTAAIIKAWRRALLVAHPDHRPAHESDRAHEDVRLLTRVRDILTDPARRLAYDAARLAAITPTTLRLDKHTIHLGSGVPGTSFTPIVVPIMFDGRLPAHISIPTVHGAFWAMTVESVAADAVLVNLHLAGSAPRVASGTLTENITVTADGSTVMLTVSVTVRAAPRPAPATPSTSSAAASSSARPPTAPPPTVPPTSPPASSATGHRGGRRMAGAGLGLLLILVAGFLLHSSGQPAPTASTQLAVAVTPVLAAAASAPPIDTGNFLPEPSPAATPTDGKKHSARAARHLQHTGPSARPQHANATPAPAVAIHAVHPSEQDPSKTVPQDAAQPTAPSPTATQVQQPATPPLSAGQARDITLGAAPGGVIQSVAADHHGAYDAWAVRVLRVDGSIATAYVDVRSGALYDWVETLPAPEPSHIPSGEPSPGAPADPTQAPVPLTDCSNAIWQDSGAPPCNDPGQTSDVDGAVKLGRPSLQESCMGSYARPAVQRWPNTWGWRCGNEPERHGAVPADRNVDVDDACLQQFGLGTFSHYLDYSDPTSWFCWRAIAG